MCSYIFHCFLCDTDSYLGSDAAVSVGMSIANALVNVASAAVATASSGAEGASSGLSMTGLVGAANSWLIGFSETAAPRPEAALTPAPDARGGVGATPQQNELADLSPLRNIASAFFGVAEAPRSAVESQASAYQTPSKQTLSSRNVTTDTSATPSELAVEDAIVRLNTMSVACVSLAALSRMLLPPEQEGDGTTVEPQTPSSDKRKIAPNELMATVSTYLFDGIVTYCF